MSLAYRHSVERDHTVNIEAKGIGYRMDWTGLSFELRQAGVGD